MTKLRFSPIGPSFRSSKSGLSARPDRIYTHGYPPSAALELNYFPRIEKSVEQNIIYIIVDVVLINYSNLLHCWYEDLCLNVHRN